MDIGGYFPEVKTDHSPKSSAKFKNGGAVPPLTVRLHMDNFTFVIQRKGGWVGTKAVCPSQ
jgi:hypothetical protein